MFYLQMYILVTCIISLISLAFGSGRDMDMPTFIVMLLFSPIVLVYLIILYVLFIKFLKIK